MDVAVIFDPAFHGTTGRAVWIIDTPSNRKWFEEQQNLDPNSAIFLAALYPTIDAAVVHMIENAQEHHPNWEKIQVIGATPAPLIASYLHSGGQITETPTGFVLRRRGAC